MEYKGIKLVQTSGACPEQYDAYNGRGWKVGYFRLRHGIFAVWNSPVGNDLIYEAYPEGDGIFERDEREYYLKEGIKALKKYLKNIS